MTRTGDLTILPGMTLDHWNEAGPRFVALLDGYDQGTDRSKQTGQALFLVIHLLGEKAETASFAPLCRLLLDGEASDLILGDGITTTLCGLLINTYDGDLAALQAVIEAQSADDFAREAALLALAYLTGVGRIPDAIGELGKWTGFSGGDSEAAFDPLDCEVQEHVINPLRGVGRNGPCPCGSGKKFKQCCLGASTAA